MQPSSLSSTTTASIGSLRAPQSHQEPHPHPQDDRARDHRQHSDLDSSSSSSALRGCASEDESLDGRPSAEVWSPSGQTSSSALMTADTVAASAAAGSVQRPALLSRHPRKSYVDDDAMTDSSSEADSDPDPDLDSDDDLDVDANGGAPLAVSSATTATMAGTLDDYMDDDSDFDSEYDSEDDYTIEANQYYNQLHAAQPLFSVIPSATQHTLVADHQQPQPPPQPQQHNTQQHIPQPHQQPNGEQTLSLANLPPLPQPPPDWVPLPPILGDPMPDFTISNANPSILGSENLGLMDFLHDWAHQSRYGRAARSQPPALERVAQLTQAPIDEVDYSDRKGDECDVQGMDWSSMETTRQAARLRRQHTYRNYVNRPGSDKWAVRIMHQIIYANLGAKTDCIRLNAREHWPHQMAASLGSSE